MPRPDEGLIHAWLDGELDAAESARVEALVASDAKWAAAAAEARGLIAASSRIVGALDHVPAGVIPVARARSTRRAPRWWMARVAALLVVVASASVVWRQRAPSVMTVDAVRGVPAPVKDAPVTGSANALPSHSPLTARSIKPPAARVPAASQVATATTLGAAASIAAPSPVAAPSVAAASAAAPAAAPAGQAVGGVAASEQRAKVAAPAAPAAANRLRDAKPLSLSEVVVTTPDLPACYLVREPAALAGRTVVHPPDSLSRVLWASAGVRPESLVVRGDSLRYATAHDAKPLAVRVPCPR